MGDIVEALLIDADVDFARDHGGGGLDHRAGSGVRRRRSGESWAGGAEHDLQAASIGQSVVCGIRGNGRRSA